MENVPKKKSRLAPPVPAEVATDAQMTETWNHFVLRAQRLPPTPAADTQKPKTEAEAYKMQNRPEGSAKSMTEQEPAKSKQRIDFTTLMAKNSMINL